MKVTAWPGATRELSLDLPAARLDRSGIRNVDLTRLTSALVANVMLADSFRTPQRRSDQQTIPVLPISQATAGQGEQSYDTVRDRP